MTANQSAEAELAILRANMQRVLTHVGEPGKCRKCGQGVRWMRHRASGTLTPYDDDGSNHLITCRESIEARMQRKLL